jgi:hypothetical protein
MYTDCLASSQSFEDCFKKKLAPIRTVQSQWLLALKKLISTRNTGYIRLAKLVELKQKKSVQ